MVKLISNKLFIAGIACLTFSCNPEPGIPLSNTLEIALGNSYSGYIDLLNKSISKDTSALHLLLEIDNIYDAAGYDHGSVLVQLMKTIGDNNFSLALNEMNKEQLNNLKQYFEVGIDGRGKSNDTLFNKYPKSFGCLGFSSLEMETLKR